RHTRSYGDWSSDGALPIFAAAQGLAGGRGRPRVGAVGGVEIAVGAHPVEAGQRGDGEVGHRVVVQFRRTVPLGAVARGNSALARSEERRVGEGGIAGLAGR